MRKLKEYSVYQGDVSKMKPEPTPKDGEVYLKDLKTGDKFSKGRQVDYVLGQWGEEERKFLPERLEVCSKAVQSFVIAGINETMNQFNGK